MLFSCSPSSSSSGKRLFIKANLWIASSTVYLVCPETHASMSSEFRWLCKKRCRLLSESRSALCRTLGERKRERASANGIEHIGQERERHPKWAAEVISRLWQTLHPWCSLPIKGMEACVNFYSIIWKFRWVKTWSWWLGTSVKRITSRTFLQCNHLLWPCGLITEIFCLWSHRNVFHLKQFFFTASQHVHPVIFMGEAVRTHQNFQLPLKVLLKSHLFVGKTQLCFCTSLQGLSWELAFFFFWIPKID